MSHSMDRPFERIIRIGVLEGYAGIPTGTWTHHPNGWALAQQAFPNLIRKWWDESDLVLLKAIRAGVAAGSNVVGSDVHLGKQDQEDLVQEIMSGLSCTKGEAYIVGVWFKSKKWIGLTGVVSCLKRHAWHRAISAVRDAPREDLQPEVDVEVDVPETTFDVFLHTHRDALWAVIRSEFSVMWAQAPARMAIFDGIVANPDLGDVALARAMGHGENDPEPWIYIGAASGVSRTRRMIRDTIPEVIRRCPALHDMVV